MLASQLLSKCIKDIEDGKWICGYLDRFEGGKVGPNSKHMGCAIGLLSINSGHMEKLGNINHAVYLTDRTISEGKLAPKEAIEAARYLAETVPLEDRIDLLERREDIGIIQDVVVNYNDSACKTPANALKWFQNALILAEADKN